MVLQLTVQFLSHFAHLHCGIVDGAEIQISVALCSYLSAKPRGYVARQELHTDISAVMQVTAGLYWKSFKA
jgi:hypothetical protein